MIKLLCLDIDGVLTDGLVYIDANGNEIKSFRLTEIDALNEIKAMGVLIAAITGENTAIVEVFKNKVRWDCFLSNCKNKAEQLALIVEKYELAREEICYIGDGKYDIPAIRYAGVGVCPSNAIQEAKDVADIVLIGAGGQSCIYELYQLLRNMREKKEESGKKG